MMRREHQACLGDKCFGLDKHGRNSLTFTRPSRVFVICPGAKRGSELTLDLVCAG